MINQNTQGIELLGKWSTRLIKVQQVLISWGKILVKLKMHWFTFLPHQENVLNVVFDLETWRNLKILLKLVFTWRTIDSKRRSWKRSCQVTFKATVSPFIHIFSFNSLNHSKKYHSSCGVVIVYIRTLMCSEFG